MTLLFPAVVRAVFFSGRFTIRAVSNTVCADADLGAFNCVIVNKLNRRFSRYNLSYYFNGNPVRCQALRGEEKRRLNCYWENGEKERYENREMYSESVDDGEGMVILW